MTFSQAPGYPYTSYTNSYGDMDGTFTVLIHPTQDHYCAYDPSAAICSTTPGPTTSGSTSTTTPVNTAPFFVDFDHLKIIEVKIGETFVYTLPAIEDAESNDFTVKFKAPLLKNWVLDSNYQTLTISPAVGDHLGYYRPSFRLEDEFGAYRRYIIPTYIRPGDP